jgi:hypothetical protein
MPIGKSNQENQDAIRILIECARECRSCAQACQDEDEAASLVACIAVNQDCADICALGADLLRRHSVFHARLIQLCAEACETCAEECARHSDMEHCRECEEVCHRCAEACRNLSGALA